MYPLFRQKKFRRNYSSIEFLLRNSVKIPSKKFRGILRNFSDGIKFRGIPWIFSDGIKFRGIPCSAEFRITEFRILRNGFPWERNFVNFFGRNKIPRNSVFLGILYNGIPRKRNSAKRNFHGNGIPKNFTEFCDKLRRNSGKKLRRWTP